MLCSDVRIANRNLHTIFQRLLISITFFFILLSYGNLYAAQVKITFTPANDSNVIGHKIYYGKSTSFSNVEDVKDATTYLIQDLQEGTTYYFAAKAYDKYGNQSVFSEIISYKIPNQIQKPENSTDNFLEYTEDFENYTVNDNPADWFDTRASNSMAEDNRLFKIFNINSNNVFGTSSTLTNIHSHHIKSYIKNLSSVEYSGRIMITDAGGGIGITFLSHYPFTDTYYRLRCTKSHPSFHLAPHPHATAGVFGTTDTGVRPKANQWYRFRIDVRDTGVQTEILAKVWPENASEPTQWQIDAYDDTSKRLVSGTFGVWSGGAGKKYWDDLEIFQ